MDPLSALPWKSTAPAPTIGRDEKWIVDTRHHWMKSFKEFCVYILLSALSLLLLFIIAPLRETAPWLSITIFFGALSTTLTIHHWFYHAMLSENVTDVVLTNKRILHLVHRLWIADEMDELMLAKIKMVNANRQGFIRQVLNYGDMSCMFDIDAGKTFHFLPAPQKWALQIERQIGKAED